MDTFKFDIDEKLRPSVERNLTGTTAIDARIGALPVPEKISLVKLFVLLLRAYRRIAPKALRRRCVFDPSCSHYSELAVRQRGFVRGLALTIARLRRCKSGVGGIDFMYLDREVE
ncbi:membrane protein insertion efficiency factor YidD [Banduia mediterranea]|uniref:membrane protein insertion efficiency factor YidD n=1 Tax=Banduia mediterranea TaxID=3075609 RepID=UPI0032C21BB3